MLQTQVVPATDITKKAQEFYSRPYTGNVTVLSNKTSKMTITITTYQLLLFCHMFSYSIIYQLVITLDITMTNKNVPKKDFEFNSKLFKFKECNILEKNI